MKKCSSCKKYKTCKELCPEKEIFVSQDQRNYFNPKEHIVSGEGIIIESDKNQVERYLEKIYEENETGHNELKEKIKRIISNEFNEKYKKIFYLRYKENLTFAEISKRIGYKHHYSSSRLLKRAIKNFTLKLNNEINMKENKQTYQIVAFFFRAKKS